MFAHASQRTTEQREELVFEVIVAAAGELGGNGFPLGTVGFVQIEEFLGLGGCPAGFDDLRVQVVVPSLHALSGGLLESLRVQ